MDCGANGTVYSELMGGYGAERDNVIYVHGITEEADGRKRDDFDNKFTIDWDDRFDDSILESVGEMCFITIGLEKDQKKNTFSKKFLAPYDAIKYVKENLKDVTVINVKGSLKYSSYQDKVQVKKEINSIYLSKIDERDKYSAKFTQTMLLNKDSVGKPDKDKGIIHVYAQILDCVKMRKNKEVKQFIPYEKMFELEVDLIDRNIVKKWVTKLLKVRKGVTEITFEGDLIEGGALITATEDDIPDDIKDLIDMGAYTPEEALAKCTENTGKERRMVIRKPAIKMQGEEGSKIRVIQKFEEKYSEEDLILDFMFQNDDEESDSTSDSDDSNGVDTDDSDWLSKL